MQGKAMAAEEDEEEEDRPKQKSITEMIDGHFTGVRYMRTDEESIKHKRLMDEYIREKLGKKRLQQEGEEEDKPKLSGKMGKLQQIADEINARGGEQQAKDPLEGVGEGAPIAYSTGIAEVSLPIEFKMRNIEETERARRSLEERGGGRGRKEEPIGNLTTNYHKYRRDHAIEMRQRDKDAKGGSAPPAPAGVPRATDQAPQRRDGAPHGREIMSDDQVYERFKKRARRVGKGTG